MIQQVLHAADEANPLALNSWEMTITIIGLVQIALIAYAIFTTYRAPQIGAGAKILWLIAVLLLPLIGGISWVFSYRHLKFMESRGLKSSI